MTEQTSQIEGPFQADHFSLLKLAKRPKNARVMAILRSKTLLPNTPDLSSEGPYVLIAHGMKWPEIPQIMCSGKDYKHTVLVGAIGGLLRAI